MEAVETSGHIDTCLKSQLLERNEDLAEIGKQAKGLVKDEVFAGMPYLANVYAGCSAGDVAFSNDGVNNVV